MLADIFQAAIRMLARREHSSFEMKQKLLQRGFPSNLIETTLQKLLTQDLLSDERFTENYIRYRTAKGYGPNRIAMELQNRGITKDLIYRFLTTPETDWQTKLQQIREKKFGTLMPMNITEYAKQIRYLQYKGFSLEQIKHVIDKDRDKSNTY